MSPVTIDTSVWINAFRFSEVGSRESFLFLDADAVFAAVSFRFGSTLITRDREQLTRLKGTVEIYSPENWE